MSTSRGLSPMPDPFLSTRRLPFLTDFSARDRRAAEEAAEHLDERQRQAEAARRKDAEGIREDLQRQLHHLLGPNGSEELREAIERERRAFRALRQPPEGLDTDDAKARKAAERRIDALVRKLGTAPARLKALGAEYGTRLRDVLSRVDGKVSDGYHLEGNLDRWLSLSPLHEHPLPWGVKPPPDDTSDPHRPFLYRPPFWGFLFSLSLWREGEGFRVDRELILDPPAGLVGNVVTVDCDDAEFPDAVVADARTQIAFGFEPPVAGILQVDVDVQCVAGKYELNVRDNFGYSDAYAHLSSHIIISLLHADGPETQFHRMDERTEVTQGDNLSIEHIRLYPVQHYFATLFSSAPVRAGRSIVVAVGTRSLDIGAAQDMDHHSRSNYQWFISSVEVRIVP